jgi:hypothetical protein
MIEPEKSDVAADANACTPAAVLTTPRRKSDFTAAQSFIRAQG